MATDGFLQTVFDGGIRHANYFNGRLLSAQDLKQDGDAEHVHHRLLGQAAGAGIVDGLWVTGATNRLTVTAGLAVNREGAALPLGATSAFTIGPSADAPPSPEAIFTDCAPLTAPASATAGGAYLLVLCPVSKFEGRAPTKALNTGSSVPADCGPKWRVEGVGFRLVPLSMRFDVGALGARRRNRVAHVLLGSEALADPEHPLIPPPQSVLDTLAGVDRHSVPLAVLYWNGRAIEFVDNWAARRRVTQPPATLPRLTPTDDATVTSRSAAPLTPWGAWCSDWRRAEAEARFLQFQDHVETLPALAFTNELSAHARFIPPACFVPLETRTVVFQAPTDAQGFTTFRSTARVRPLPRITREQAGALLAQSWWLEAIDLDTSPSLQYFELPRGAGPRYYVMIVKPAAAPMSWF
jgi:hypothetical protein